MKKKCTVWVEEDVWEKAQSKYEEYNFKSVSELANTALEFYLSYRAAGEAEVYLTEALNQTLRSTVQQTENRIARILFKIAVEDAMMKQLLVGATRIGPDEANKLRKYCIDEIRTLNGILDMKKAAERSAEAEEWE